jgi:hypothetical protein
MAWPGFPSADSHPNEVADFCGVLQSPTFAEEKHAFRFDRAQEIHDRGSVGRADAEVDHGQIFSIRAGLHRTIEPANGLIKLRGESAKIIREIREKDILAKFIQGRSRVAGEPVVNDVLFGMKCHQVDSLSWLVSHLGNFDPVT